MSYKEKHGPLFFLLRKYTQIVEHDTLILVCDIEPNLYDAIIFCNRIKACYD